MVYIFPITGYMSGKKLKASAVRALGELLAGSRIIRGSEALPVSRWLVKRGFVTQKLSTPEGHWRIEYEYALTPKGTDYFLTNGDLGYA